MKREPAKGKFRRRVNKISAKYKLTPKDKIEYKNITLLQKFLNERGRIIPRRLSGVTAKEQRALMVSIKRARHLALLTTGGVK